MLANHLYFSSLTWSSSGAYMWYKGHEFIIKQLRKEMIFWVLWWLFPLGWSRAGPDDLCFIGQTRRHHRFLATPLLCLDRLECPVRPTSVKQIYFWKQMKNIWHLRNSTDWFQTRECKDFKGQKEFMHLVLLTESVFHAGCLTSPFLLHPWWTAETGQRSSDVISCFVFFHVIQSYVIQSF